MLRFLFGHGWWILWYLAFYAIILLFVVMILAMFGQELKAAGEKPDTPSPGSFMVVMIGVGLVTVTLINLAIYAPSLLWPPYAKVGVILGVPTIIGAVAFPLNIKLATEQNHPYFWMNLILSAVVVIANLILMQRATNPST